MSIFYQKHTISIVKNKKLSLSSPQSVCLAFWTLFLSKLCKQKCTRISTKSETVLSLTTVSSSIRFHGYSKTSVSSFKAIWSSFKFINFQKWAWTMKKTHPTARTTCLSAKRARCLKNSTFHRFKKKLLLSWVKKILVFLKKNRLRSWFLKIVSKSFTLLKKSGQKLTG